MNAEHLRDRLEQLGMRGPYSVFRTPKGAHIYCRHGAMFWVACRELAEAVADCLNAVCEVGPTEPTANDGPDLRALDGLRLWFIPCRQCGGYHVMSAGAPASGAFTC